ncbi:MAG: long-chain fatty acid--CoA ligase [Nitrososphaerota archaeon]
MIEQNSGQLEEGKPWLLHWPKGVPTHIEYPEKTLSELLDQRAKARPSDTQFIFFGRRISFQETSKTVQKLAASFQKIGVSKGTRVAVMLPNSPQFAFSYYAILKSGGVVVPVNPLYTERELNTELIDSGAELIVVLDSFYRVAKKASEGTRVKEIIVTNISDFMPKLTAVLGRLTGKIENPKITDTHIDFSSLLTMDSQYTEVDIDVRRDPAILMYTGGTTGTPKAAILTNMNLVSNAMMVSAWGNLSSSDGVLAVLPWFHVYGMTVALNMSITSGVWIVVLPRFSVHETFKAIKKYHPTTFPGVFSMYIALLNSPLFAKYKSDIRCLKSGLSGAAPLPVEIAKNWSAKTGSILAEGYGLSEASPVTHANPLDDPSHIKLGSIGIPMPDTDAKIVDMETGTRELKPMEVGELIVKGPQVGLGYWNRTEETKATFRDGWLYTGDIAYMDNDGYFYIVDRKKDMINVGGLKVWPREVEEVAYKHKAVRMAAVVGIPDNFYGEVPKLFVVLKDEFKNKVDPEEIRSFIKENLAPYKVPKVVEIKDELPTTLVGKVLRRKLKEA